MKYIPGVCSWRHQPARC